MSDPGFAERLAYARWLDGRGRLAPENDADFATRAGVGYQWFAKWRKRPDAPDDRTTTARLVAALRVSGEWLLDGLGEAPRPELWREWWEARNAASQLDQSTGQASAPPRGTKLPDTEVKEFERQAENERSRTTGKASGRTRGRPGRGPQ